MQQPRGIRLRDLRLIAVERDRYRSQGRLDLKGDAHVFAACDRRHRIDHERVIVSAADQAVPRLHRQGKRVDPRFQHAVIADAAFRPCLIFRRRRPYFLAVLGRTRPFPEIRIPFRLGRGFFSAQIRFDLNNRILAGGDICVCEFKAAAFGGRLHRKAVCGVARDLRKARIVRRHAPDLFIFTVYGFK